LFILYFELLVRLKNNVGCFEKVGLLEAIQNRFYEITQGGIFGCAVGLELKKHKP
jgi:hypothetical protein